MDTYNLQLLKQSLSPGNPFDLGEDMFTTFTQRYHEWLQTPGLTLEEKKEGAVYYAGVVNGL